MKIIIEGCDGTGKTTLAKQLAEKYELDVIHVTNRDSNCFGFYYFSIGKEDVVWDRNMIGEVIYPNIFERKGKIDAIDLKFLIDRAKSEGVIFLILTADHDEIYRRLYDRGNEMLRILNNFRDIDNQFRCIAKIHDIPLIDTSKISFEEICEKYIEKGANNDG